MLVLYKRYKWNRLKYGISNILWGKINLNLWKIPAALDSLIQRNFLWIAQSSFSSIIIPKYLMWSTPCFSFTPLFVVISVRFEFKLFIDNYLW